MTGLDSARHHAAILAMAEEGHQLSGGFDVKCPVCGENSPPAWNPYETRRVDGWQAALPAAKAERRYESVALEWMRCANEECEQLIVRITESRVAGTIGGGGPLIQRDEWFARPRFGDSTRPVDPVVLGTYRRDYLEAAAILDLSPRMAAVLARRIVGDLLKQYAQKTHFGLTARIDSFIADGGHPASLTSNLHHLREIADFGAHTQVAEQENDSGVMEAVIVEADRDDAEWTLDLVDRLFDYFIVQPAKDEAMKKKWDENIARTGRRALRRGETEDDES